MGLIRTIDDDSSVRGTMKKILERAGHEAREAEAEAVRLKLFRARTAGRGRDGPDDAGKGRDRDDHGALRGVSGCRHPRRVGGR